MKNFFMCLVFLLFSISTCYASMHFTITSYVRDKIKLTGDAYVSKMIGGTGHLRFNKDKRETDLNKNQSVSAVAWKSGGGIKVFDGWIKAENVKTKAACLVKFNQGINNFVYFYRASIQDNSPLCTLEHSGGGKYKLSFIYVSQEKPCHEK